MYLKSPEVSVILIGIPSNTDFGLMQIRKMGDLKILPEFLATTRASWQLS